MNDAFIAWILFRGYALWKYHRIKLDTLGLPTERHLRELDSYWARLLLSAIPTERDSYLARFLLSATLTERDSYWARLLLCLLSGIIPFCHFRNNYIISKLQIWIIFPFLIITPISNHFMQNIAYNMSEVFCLFNICTLFLIQILA